jgi:hypothetical protein
MLQARRHTYRVLVGKLEGNRRLETPGAGGKVTLNGSLRNWLGVLDWINLAQGTDKWRVVVNTVMNLWFP